MSQSTSMSKPTTRLRRAGLPGAQIRPAGHRHGPACVRQRRYELERTLAATRLLVKRAELGEFRRETCSARRIAAALGRRLEQLTAEAGDGRP